MSEARSHSGAGASWLAPAVLLGVAALVRGVVAARTSAIFEDGPHFLATAQAFSEGRYAEALAHPYHPLYPALVAVFEAFFGDFERAALFVSVLGGSIGVTACFVLLRRAFDERVAWIGAGLFAISPYPVRMSADVASEGTYLAFFGVALALLFAANESRNALRFFMAGIAAGGAYLARPEGAGLVVLGSVWLFLLGLRGDRTLREVVRGVACLAAGGAVLIVPYVAILSRQADGLALSGKKSVLELFGFSFESGSALLVFAAACGFGVIFAARSEAARAAITRASHWIPASAVALVALGWLVAPELVNPIFAVVTSTVRPELIVFLVAGLFWTCQSGWRERDVFFFLIAIGYLALLFGLLANYGYVSRRHFVPLMPVALGYVAIGIVRLADIAAAATRDASAPRWAHASGAFAITVSIALGVIALPKTLHDHRRDALAERLAAQWLAEQELRSGWVASNKRRISYYADRRWQPLERDGVLRSLDELAELEVRYVVADARWSPRPSASNRTRRELHRVEAGGRTALVYELVRSEALARK